MGVRFGGIEMIARYAASVLLAGACAVLSVCFGAQPAVIDDASLVAAGASPGQWLTIGRDYAETRFSPLKQIDASNVGRLGLAWSYDTQSLRGLEATPLVALDAATGALRWEVQTTPVDGALHHHRSAARLRR
jgi:glucose dehydrogenase